MRIIGKTLHAKQKKGAVDLEALSFDYFVSRTYHMKKW